MNILIHLKDRKGLYTCYKIDGSTLFCKTKKYEFTTHLDNFKCMAGGAKNFGKYIPETLITRRAHKDIDELLSEACRNKDRELFDRLLRATSINRDHKKMKQIQNVYNEVFTPKLTLFS